MKTTTSIYRRHFAFAYVLLVAVLASCHKIHDGTVTNKYIVPAHSYKYSTMMMVGKVPITTWYTVYVGDEYVLTVTKVNGKDTITEDFYIDEANWKCMSVGNIFNDSIPCTRDDDGTK